MTHDERLEALERTVAGLLEQLAAQKTALARLQPAASHDGTITRRALELTLTLAEQTTGAAKAALALSTATETAPEVPPP